MAQLGANLPSDWKIDEKGKRGQLVKVAFTAATGDDIETHATLTDGANDIAIAVLNYDHKADEQVSAKQIQAGQVLEVLLKGAVPAGSAIGPDPANPGYGKVRTDGHRIGFVKQAYADLDLGQVFIHPHG